MADTSTQFRLDLYRRGDGKPYNQLHFTAAGRRAACDAADRRMARRPRSENGLLYDLDRHQPEDDYMMTIAGGR